MVLTTVLVLGGCAVTSDPSPASSGAPVHVTSPTPSRWKVVAVGDSVTSGTNCNCTPFPQLYAKDISRTRGVPTSAQNFGAPGQDSDELLAELQNSSSSVARAVAGANIDLVTIGANDFSDHHGQVTNGSCTGNCLKDELVHMRSNVLSILKNIQALRHGLPTAVLVTGYWNVFEDGRVAQAFPPTGRRATQQLTWMANQEIRSAAHTTGETYVDLYRPFNGPASQGNITNLLAPDGDHPNARGQQLIADALVAAGLRGLVRD